MTTHASTPPSAPPSTPVQTPGRHGPVRALRPTPLTPLALDAATLSANGEWGRRQRENAERTLPHSTRELRASGTLANFRRLLVTGGLPPSPHQGMVFQDSDLYKHLEALAWEIARSGSAQADAEIEAAAALLAAVQAEDGYLNTAYQGTERQPLSDLAQDHELYCAGHLFQASVADHRVTGSRRLLDVAVGLADHLVDAFGQQRRLDYDGHPEVETALVELYRETGTTAYLDLARQFVDLRGSGVLTRGSESTAHGERASSYYQDHLPVRETGALEGHAVRAMYLEAGVVDVAVEDGDAALLESSIRRWEDMVATKVYITGGTGSRHSTEGFGDPFELPPDRAYAETCAAIAAIHWAWRLQLATGHVRYGDFIDTLLHNAFAVGMGTDGTSFFYSNPLQVRAGHVADTQMQAGRRLQWFACACCPPNIARTVATVHTFAAAVDQDQGFHLSQYMAGRYRFGEGQDQREVEVISNYPWEAAVMIRVLKAGSGEWALHLRIPQWSATADITLNSQPTQTVSGGDEVVRQRTWAAGDEVRLDLAMPGRFVRANPRVDAVLGCVAIQRGPVVYCVEDVDNPGLDLADVLVDTSVTPVPVTVNGLGALGLRVSGSLRDLAGLPLYRDVKPETAPGAATGSSRPVTLTAVPYHLWGNRAEGAMRVFIPEQSRRDREPASSDEPTGSASSTTTSMANNGTDIGIGIDLGIDKHDCDTDDRTDAS